MRDILFRGKTSDGKWVEGGYCNGYEQVEQVLDFVDGFRQCLHHYIAVDKPANRGLPNKMLLYSVLPKTIGQYTGLCDKNGVKIFEGDIVESISGKRDYIGVVRYCKAHFAIEWDRLKDVLRNDLHFWASERKLEVIGNIHENKELLEGNG